MKALKLRTLSAALGLLGLISAGCSDVAFSPVLTDSGSLIVDTGKMRTEYFLFNENRPLSMVDVIFVVDNSLSMAEEQQKMATRLSSFVDSLVAVNWQIGITTTDLSNGIHATNGRLVPMVGTGTQILSRATPNYEQVFLDTVTANGTPPNCAANNTCASGDEQPLEAIRLAIAKRNTDNAGFFRPGADVVAIVLSDEDELSTGDLSYDPTSAEDILDEAAAAWSGEKSVTGYGIIIKPTDSVCLAAQTPNGGHAGTFVEHFAEITNGETGSICADDYGPALASIGRRVLKKATSIFLSAMPVTGSVRLNFIPADPTITWTVVGQTIKLSDLPLKGTRVVVTYERQ